MTRAPAPALSPAEAARVAAFDAAPTQPECDPERVQTVARAICESDEDGPWASWPTHVHVVYRRYAAAAIAAVPPSPAEEAVKRVEALCNEAENRWPDFSPAGDPLPFVIEIGDIRAALASPAPAPQGEEEDRRRRGFDCPTCKGIGRTFHSDMPDGSSRAQGCLACDGTGRSAR